MAKSNNELDQAFEELERDCGENRTIRREMIANLRKVAADPNMAITQYDKAMVVQSKLMIFKTLDDLVKSDEDISFKKLKVKLARKDSESNGLVGSTIVALLKEIRATGDLSNNESLREQQDLKAAQDAVAARAEELAKTPDAKKIEVSEGELEECGAIASDAARPDDEKEEE